MIESLKEGARTGTGASSHAWLRSTLVVSEIAIALVLLTVSGAFLRSFQKMRAVDPGFRPDHVLVASYQLPLRQYPTDVSVAGFNHAVIDRLSSKPGIVAVGITNILPASGFYGEPHTPSKACPQPVGSCNSLCSRPPTATTSAPWASRCSTADTFTMDDRSNTPLVVIVNQSMAKHCWPGQRAIGKRMHVGNPQKD